MFAVAQGRHELTDLLLKNGALTNVGGDYLLTEPGGDDAQMIEWLHGGTALHIASYQGNLGLVNHLLKAGVDADSRDDEGRTPLQWSIKRRRRQIVAALLAVHADLNIVDRQGRSALQKAIESGDQNTVEQLKRAGAKSN